MKKMLTLLILSSTALVFADSYPGSGGCSSQGQYPQGQGTQYTQAPQSQSQQDDQALRRTLQDSLRASNKYNNVNLTVNNGYVTLTGTVANQDDKNAVEQHVRGIKGVQGISNQLTLQNSGSKY